MLRRSLNDQREQQLSAVHNGTSAPSSLSELVLKRSQPGELLGMGFETDSVAGFARVTKVLPASVAEASGVVVGMEIFAVNDRKVRQPLPMPHCFFVPGSVQT